MKRRRYCILFLVLVVCAGAFWLGAHFLLRKKGKLPHANDRTLRVALCQFDARPDEYEWNLQHALRFAEEASENGADMIVMPEYSFCTADDAINGNAFFHFRRNFDRLVDTLSDFADDHDCYLVANWPTEFKDKDGTLHRRTRSHVFDPDGKLAGIYDKRGLAILDGCSGLESGEPPVPLNLSFGRMGIMICRDSNYPRAFPAYRDADLLLVQFAHITAWNALEERPVWIKNDIWDAHADFPRLARSCAHKLKIPIIMVNKAGMEPTGSYTGGSCVFGANGKQVARAGFGSDILYVDFPLNESGRLYGASPVQPPKPERN